MASIHSVTETQIPTPFFRVATQRNIVLGTLAPFLKCAEFANLICACKNLQQLSPPQSLMLRLRLCEPGGVKLGMFPNDQRIRESILKHRDELEPCLESIVKANCADVVEIVASSDKVTPERRGDVFCVAAELGKIELMDIILQCKALPEFIRRRKAAQTAAKCGQLDAVAKLWNMPDLTLDDRGSIFSEATRDSKNAAIVRYLLMGHKNIAQMHQQIGLQNVVDWAPTKERNDLVDQLLQIVKLSQQRLGQSVNHLSNDPSRRRAAVSPLDLELLTKLLSSGKLDEHYLARAVHGATNDSIIKLLSAHETMSDEHIKDCLFSAAHFGDLDKVKALVTNFNIPQEHIRAAIPSYTEPHLLPENGILASQNREINRRLKAVAQYLNSQLSKCIIA